MKSLLIGILVFGCTSVFAQSYECLPYDGQKDVGLIEFSGDPMSMSVNGVLINGQSQTVRQSEFENVYLYLANGLGAAEHTALEIVNYPARDDHFDMSVYKRKNGILAVTNAFRVSRYFCNLVM